MPEELSNLQRDRILLELLKHLNDRAPYLDLFVERVIDQNSEILGLSSMELEQTNPIIKARIGKIVSLSIRDFLLDAFGKSYLIPPPGEGDDEVS